MLITETQLKSERVSTSVRLTVAPRSIICEERGRGLKREGSANRNHRSKDVVGVVRVQLV